LFGYWLAWALYPAQPPGFFAGFAAHWNKGNNFGNAFDVWFLNLFPTVKPYVANGGGYLTLSFIPTLGTMILGLAAGRWLRAAAPTAPMRRLAGGGGDRGQLDRGLRDGAPVGAVHPGFVPHPPGRARLRVLRHAVRTPAARHRGAAGVLGAALLDVPAEAVSQDMRRPAGA